MSVIGKLLKWLLIISFPFILFFVIFVRLDQGEEPKDVDVIIVPEGASVRAYKAVDLLLEGYSSSNRLIVSPGTEYNLPNYLTAGANKEQLIIEENATSTWTNAINTIEIMEENNWESALVVTTEYHTRRTRLSFERASIGKEMDFTYVSAYYEDDNGEPLTYLDSEYGRAAGARETLKYFGYLLGLYYFIDMD